MKMRWWIGLAVIACAGVRAEHNTLPFTLSVPEASYSESGKALEKAVPERKSQLQSSIERVLKQVASNTRQGFPFPQSEVENTLRVVREQLQNGRSSLNLNKKQLSAEEEMVLLDNVQMLVEYAQQVLLSQLKNPTNSDEMDLASGAESLRRRRGRNKPRWTVRARSGGSPLLAQEWKRREDLYERGNSQAFLDFSKYLQSQWGGSTALTAGKKPQVSQREISPSTASPAGNSNPKMDDVASEVDSLLSRVRFNEEREEVLTNSEDFFETAKEEVEEIGRDAESRLSEPARPSADSPATDPEVR